MALTAGIFYSGAGVPSNGDGSDGDHYRNTSNQDLWFKSSGLWSLIGNLYNGIPDGVGTVILQGSGTPNNLNGENGHYYRDTGNQNLWYKNSGLWSLIANLGVGAVPISPGTPFIEGAGVPDNGDGDEGQYYRNTTNQDIYRKGPAVWARIGTWADAVDTGTIFLTGTGVPSGGTGSNGNYYRDTDTEDIYYKSSGTWNQVGNWLGVSDGTVTISTWDMTGALTEVAPVVATGATFGGTDPSFTLTPNAGSLPGGGSYYLAGVETSEGITLSGAGEYWAEIIKPTVVGGNLHSYGLVILNSGATLTDFVTLLNGGTPAHDVWGAYVSNRTSTPGSVSVDTIANNVITPGSDVNLSLANGDSLYIGIDTSTKALKAQRNTDAVSTLPVISTTGMPASNTFKVAAVLLFTSATPTFSPGSLTFDPATDDAGKTPFLITGEAVLPVDAADNTVYEVVTSGGTYGGVSAKVGDFVWLYDNLTKIFRIEQGYALQGNPNKRYKIVSGVLRQASAGAGWELIDDANHQPTNVASVTVNGSGNLEITYNFTAVNKGAFSAWPDETFSNWGMRMGASVGNSSTTIEIYGAFGGAIVASDLVTPIKSITPLGLEITAQTIDPNAGTITVTHGTQSHTSGNGSPVSVCGSGNNGFWTVTSTKSDFTLTYRRGCIGGISWVSGKPSVNTQIAYPAAYTVTGAQNSAGKIRLNVASHTLYAGMVVDVADVTGTTEANGQWYIDSVGTEYVVLGNNTTTGTPSAFVNAWTSGGTITMVKAIWQTDHLEIFHPYSGSTQFVQIQSQKSATMFHYEVDAASISTYGFHVYVRDAAGSYVTVPTSEMRFNYDRDVLLPAVIPGSLVGHVNRDNIPCDASGIYSANGNIWFMGIFEV